MMFLRLKSLLILAAGTCSCVPLPSAAPPDASIGVSEVVFLDTNAIVILAADDSLWESTDNGESWTQSANPPEAEVRLSDLTRGAAGSFWALRIDYSTSPGRFEIVRSRDRGRTFEIISNFVKYFIEMPSGDPVLISSDGQLWNIDGSDAVPATTSPIGEPNPDNVASRQYLYCMNQYYTVSAVGGLAYRLWHSDHQALTWTLDIEAYSYHPRIVCGEFNYMWVVIDRTVVFFDSQTSSWQGGEVLGGICNATGQCASWVAADERLLYVSGWDVVGSSYIVGVEHGVQGNALPLPIPGEANDQLFKLEVSPDGRLWAFNESIGLYRYDPVARSWNKRWP